MIQSRIKTKHDTTANWNNAHGFIPMAGEIIIYDDYQTIDGTNVPGIKVGTGNAYVQDLAFVDSETKSRLMAHIENNNVHVTPYEKSRWGNKINIADDYEIAHGELLDETLIFTRD